jgi:AraC family transcriptional regulator
MDTATGVAPRAIDTYAEACRALPLLGRQGRPGTGISLYSWELEPKRDVRIPRTPEVTVAVHLGGARHIRVFTPEGVSRICSQPGAITLIPRERPIHYLIEGGVEFATLHLSDGARRVLGDSADRLLDLPHCLFAMRDDYVVASVRALLKASSATDRDAKRYTTKVLESLAWHLLRVVSDNDAEPIPLADETEMARAHRACDDAFAAILAQIDERLGERLSLDALAAMAGMGRTAFCERFSASVGCPPHRYLIGRRIGKARHLLQEGASSVTDIAYRLGFSSASHFSTVFKRATGVSPQQVLPRRIVN